MNGPVITRTVGKVDDYAFASLDALLSAWGKAYGQEACRKVRALDDGQGIVILSHDVIEVSTTSWVALARRAGINLATIKRVPTMDEILAAFNDERPA